MHQVPEVVDHLVKLWMHPKHESVNHWMSEVYSNLPRVPKMKQVGLPDKNFIMKYTYEGHADLIPDFVDEVTAKYGQSRDVDLNAIDAWVKSYFEWFSKSLTNSGRIEKNSVKDWILQNL